MKVCPFCAERVESDATSCVHCGETLARIAPPPLPESVWLPWYFRTSTILVVLLSIGPLGLPLVWWRPRMSPLLKVLVTAGVCLGTWALWKLSVWLLAVVIAQYRDLGIL